jgi:glycosyltransferase involved in cell wall biosynthesis
VTDILFILPVGGGSGGAHSVMQEANAMRHLGIDVAVAVNASNAGKLRQSYGDMPEIARNIVGYQGADGLGTLLAERSPGVAVATTNQSVHVLAKALSRGKLGSQRTAYYVQDYEPLFYPPESDEWLTAYASYGLIPSMVHFAKTGWVQETVRNNHRVEVHKVAPSIDHDVYYPCINQPRADGEKLSVVAMLRPATRRRAPRRTVRILNRLAHEFGDRLSCSVFGCTNAEIADQSLELSGVDNHGVLRREDVGRLFRTADLFLDLSDYQAFGRTALEAMSCGTIAVVPAHGGSGEYARDGFNGFVVDTRNDDAILAAVRGFVGMTAGERGEMRLNGITAGFRHSPENAALSELRLLAPHVFAR